MRHIYIYFYRFFGDFIPIVPILGLFYADYGLTLSQISTVFLALAVTVFALEIPTGVLADRVNVKSILILSRLFKLLAFCLIFLHPTYPIFLTASVLWGIASSLDSGAWQSYLYSYCESRVGLDFPKQYGRASSASLAGLLLATAAATQIDLVGYHGLQLMGLTALIISFIQALFLPHVRVEQDDHPHERQSLTLHLQDLKKILFKSPPIATLLVIGIASGGIKGSLDEYTSILLSEKGLTVAVVGYFLVAFEIIKSSSAAVVGNLPYKPIFQPISLAIIGLCLVSAGVTPSVIFAAVALALLYLVDTYLWIHNDAALQKYADNKYRATVASLKNFGTEFTAFLVFLSGSFMGNLPVKHLYMIGGSIVIFISVVTIYTNSKKKNHV